MTNIVSGLPRRYTPRNDGVYSANQSLSHRHCERPSEARQSKNYILCVVVIIFSIISSNSFANESQTLKWNSKEGITRLNNTEYKNDFYQLADHFQPQINPLYCGIATSVIILNTIYDGKEIASQKELEVKKPQAFGGGFIPFNSYSQITFLNERTDKIKDRKIINLQNITLANENDAKNFDVGVSLKQLADILSKAYKLKIKLIYANKADEKFINKFRQNVKNITADNDKFIIANFNGKNLGLKTHGHISPIVAFDETSDSALVMDVAGHKNGWYWVKIEDLYDAMNTKDGDNYRGYLIVS